MTEREYGKDRVLDLLIELGGRASLDNIVALARTKKSPLSKVHIWDGLIALARKGTVRNESGIWVVVSS